MSYRVLARKWRPQHFRDMLGQEPVLRALINALDSDRLHHAYLFTGMRGVGKTTIARIFAKCLNCETRGVSSDPCGECSACLDIEAGRFFDLVEVDAASRSKVEGTRELLENVPYAPASGRYKVYLIDEVHMFSTHSFNALLKTLEEPPEHVKFLLATTDPQKVPATVLSRCLQFNLKRMTPALLTEYLASLLTKEDIKFEIPALDLIARASEGSVRDSLSLVEQASAFGEGSIQANDVESMLGRASVDRLLALIEALASSDMPALFAQIETLAQYAPDFHELLGEILSLLHSVALLQTIEGSVADTVPGYDRLVTLAANVDADAVQLFYQIGLHARRDMPFAPDTREAFDMALLRMNAFKPQNGLSGSQTGTSGGPGSLKTGNGVASTAASPSARAMPATPESHPSGVNSGQPAAVGATADPSVDAKPGGLPIRGEVSAGGSLRAAALAAARGETPPDETASIQMEQPRVTRSTPVVSPPQSASTAAQTGDVAAVVPEAELLPGGVEEPARNGTSGTAGPEAAGLASADAGSIIRPEGGKPAETRAEIRPGTGAANRNSTRDIQNGQAPADGGSPALNKNSLTSADWPQIVRQLDIAGMPLQLASNCELLEVSQQSVRLRLEEGSEHLNTARFLERVESAVSDWLGRAVTLQVDMVQECLSTPAKLTEQQLADELAAAHASIDKDPIVQQLIDRVDGAVDKSSVRPLSGS